MSVAEVDVWTCDRCKAKEEVNRGAKPQGWAHADVRYVDRGSQEHRLPVKVGSLCNECRDSFAKWWVAES